MDLSRALAGAPWRPHRTRALVSSRRLRVTDVHTMRSLPAYAELLCLTNFSFQRGASHPRELVERAKELGYDALGIADECSLAGIVRAHEAAETVGLPLIIGSQFRFEEGDRIALF